MSRDHIVDARNRRNGDIAEEAEALLSNASSDNDTPAPRSTSSRPPAVARRQSSFSKLPPNGQPRTPRTPNRVRFNLEAHENRGEDVDDHGRSSLDETAEWMDNEDYMSTLSPGAGRNSTGQRAPLLTDIEAPSVTVANAGSEFDTGDLLESARPKSGMRSAFMNMANSIM